MDGISFSAFAVRERSPRIEGRAVVQSLLVFVLFDSEPVVIALAAGPASKKRRQFPAPFFMSCRLSGDRSCAGIHGHVRQPGRAAFVTISKRKSSRPVGHEIQRHAVHAVAQRAQCTSVRSMPRLRSSVVSTAPSRGVSKLGQPVPLSNLVAP